MARSPKKTLLALAARAARKVPVIGRRLAASDARSAELRERVHRLQSQLAATKQALADAKTVSYDPTVPSYRARAFASRRQWTDVETAAASKLPVRLLGDKQVTRAIIESNNINVALPQELGAWPSIHDVDLDALPDEVVLKLARSHSSVGVLPLRRLSAHTWLDVMNGRIFDKPAIVAEFDRVAVKRGSGELFAERLLVEPERPNHCAIDWKFFCFDGVVGFVMQRLLEPRPDKADHDKLFKWWDRDWNVLPSLRHETILDNSLPAARHPSQLIAAAETLARLTGRAHIRVDLYDLPDGVYFGEFTAEPGGDWIMPAEYDRKFGLMWEEAESRVLGRLMGPAIRRGELPLSTYVSNDVSTSTPPADLAGQ